MPKKDTKLQKLSESIHAMAEEMRGPDMEGLDRVFWKICLESARQLTDGRQQAKVKHLMTDVVEIVFFCGSGRKR